MKLDEFQVSQIGAGTGGHRQSVPGSLTGIARMPPGHSDSAGREHNMRGIMGRPAFFRMVCDQSVYLAVTDY